MDKNAFAFPDEFNVLLLRKAESLYYGTHCIRVAGQKYQFVLIQAAFHQHFKNPENTFTKHDDCTSKEKSGATFSER